MPILFFLQTLFLPVFWYFCFRHNGWSKGWTSRCFLFLAPFAAGCLFLWADLQWIPLHILRHWHWFICMYCTLTVLLLLPQWYKLMWFALLSLPARSVSDHSKLLCTVIFSVIMMLAIIFLFALYYLWLDRLSGFSQGLYSAITCQPVLLDFATAFYFSFSCYFSLGYGNLYPFGAWFYLLIFLECLIALINNGIILFYIFHLLFEKNRQI